MSCIDNENNFISNNNCNNDNKSNKNLDLYYNPIINYCNKNDNISKQEICTDFYSKISDKTDIYYRQKLNSFMNEDYSKWNTKWKTFGCFSNLPISLYNYINKLKTDAEKDNILKEYINKKTLDARNLCYTGEAIENQKELLYGNCIYSEDKKFKLCQENNGDVKLYNNSKNSYKIINNKIQPAINTNTECDSWAKRGECKNNPSYMIKNCATSCSNANFYKLMVKKDGNIVNANINEYPFWSTETQTNINAKDKDAFLVMRNDGKLVLYNKDGKIVKEINSIEPFNNKESLDNKTNCCNPVDIMNKEECQSNYVKSYKVYLNDMNKLCKINNNVIDKDICDELFNNEFNLNDHDTLISKKKEVCLDTKNYLNTRCIKFNNKDKTQLKKQLDYCKQNVTDPTCKQLYTEYKKINSENEFVKSTEFILLMVFIAIFVVLTSGGYFMFRKKNNIQTFINKKY